MKNVFKYLEQKGLKLSRAERRDLENKFQLDSSILLLGDVLVKRIDKSRCQDLSDNVWFYLGAIDDNQRGVRLKNIAEILKVDSYQLKNKVKYISVYLNSKL